MGDGGLDSLGRRAQLGEVIALHLDGDARARARKHVINAVPDRLSDGHLDARDPREILAQRSEQLFARARGEASLARRIHVECQIDFTRLGALDVFVILGAACAAHRRHDLGMIGETAIHQVRQLIAGIQGCPGLGDHRDDQCTLLELRQEPRAQARKAHDGDGKQGCARDGNRLREAQAHVQGAGVPTLQRTHDAWFVRGAHRARCGQGHRAQGRRQSQSHKQGCTQRDAERQAQRLQQSSFHAIEEEDGCEHEHDDERRHHDGRTHFDAGLVHRG